MLVVSQSRGMVQKLFVIWRVWHDFLSYFCYEIDYQFLGGLFLMKLSGSWALNVVSDKDLFRSWWGPMAWC